MQNDTPLSEMTYFSPAFRTGLKHCKYTTWAADLTEEQLLVLLWLVGECRIRGFIYSTLVEELPKSEEHQERKRMIIALKMLHDLIKGSISLQEVREHLQEVRKHIDSSCNKKVMAQMQNEMIVFSEDFRAELTMGKYTRWVLYRDFTEESLFGLISLVGEYGHHAFFLREILHSGGCHVRGSHIRITVAFKMLAKMVRGQRWSYDEMRGEIASVIYLREKVWDDWPSIDSKVLNDWSSIRSTETNFEGIKVVCINDSKTMRRTMETLLKKAGCKVVTATDGYEALSKIMEHQPDIIFIDDMMPCLDGYQTCALIRSNPAFKTIPIIMLGSKVGLSECLRGTTVGVTYYGSCPFTREELLNFVKVYVMEGGFIIRYDWIKAR
jgi:twitching motility two-component system response regulator PilG